MNKSEFEARVGNTVSDREYAVVEVVYMYHPSIGGTTGKDDIARIYKTLGMVVIQDMLPRAQAIAEVDAKIFSLRTQMDKLRDEKESLSKWG